jgi:hypothetical protein
MARVITKSDWRADYHAYPSEAALATDQAKGCIQKGCDTYKAHATATPEYLASLLLPYDAGRVF